LKMNRRFDGKSPLSLQGPVVLLGSAPNTRMEATHPSQMPVDFQQTTLRLVTLHNHRCENLKEVASWRDRGIDGSLLLVRILQEMNHRVNCFITFGHTGRRNKGKGKTEVAASS
jgi:hypothetical protein